MADQPLPVAVKVAEVLADDFAQEFVWIPKGRLVTDEHELVVENEFYIATHEVTQGQWHAVMGTSPWLGLENVVYEDLRPAVNISWNDVHEFIETLNTAAGVDRYRLPTDTEWEYAVRAGTTSTWFFGDNPPDLVSYAWYYDTGDTSAQDVATKLPNPWGLYDVYGNVWEWVEDDFGLPAEQYNVDTGAVSSVETQAAAGIEWRILRGGGWLTGPESARSAGRVGLTEEDRGCYIGIRLAMNPPQ